jgi:NADPH-dependent curcumin reductase CurA
VSAQNRQFRLGARPDGPVKHSDFELTTEPVPEPGEGEVLVRSEYISLDPAMRGWMNDARSYVPPVGLGEVMRAGVAGTVVASNSDALNAGDAVTGMLGVQEYAVAKPQALIKVDPSLAPLPAYLGALGMPGWTAYFGLLDIGKPQPGQTVLVSGAAGAVGGVVGQLAKLHDARAVGIAGGPAKCEYIVQELGFDVAIDYKHEDVPRKLREHCPDGVDVYFDNVGGDILDAALARLARKARVVICGAISQYNSAEFQGPKNYMSLLINNASMTGFVVFNYFSRYPEAIAALTGWHAEGKLTARVDVAEGFENFVETLNRLFKGENTGKLVLKIA